MSDKTGGCLCGAIRYTISGEAQMVAACHCRDCQKQTGTAYSVLLGIEADAITIDSGTLKTFAKNGTSGLPVERKFCGDCGSPIYSDAKAIEGLLFVKGGTLDEPATIPVGAEIWCSSKAEWAGLPESIPKMPENPPAG